MEIACLVSVASRHPAPHPDPPRDHSSVVAGGFWTRTPVPSIPPSDQPCIHSVHPSINVFDLAGNSVWHAGKLNFPCFAFVSTCFFFDFGPLYELLIQIKNIFFVHPAAADDWGIFFWSFSTILAHLFTYAYICKLSACESGHCT